MWWGCWGLGGGEKCLQTARHVPQTRVDGPVAPPPSSIRGLYLTLHPYSTHPDTSIHPHPTPPSTHTPHPHTTILPLARVSSFSQLLTASSSLTTAVSRSFPCCEDTNNGKYLGGADCCPMDLKNNKFGLFLRSVFAQANEIMFRVEKW